MNLAQCWTIFSYYIQTEQENCVPLCSLSDCLTHSAFSYDDENKLGALSTPMHGYNTCKCSEKKYIHDYFWEWSTKQSLKNQLIKAFDCANNTSNFI